MIDTIVIPISLAFDAFAVAVCYGISSFSLNFKSVFRVALSFGIFQFLMPIAGWYGSTLFKSALEGFDHWIAFGLLLYIGINMILEYRKGSQCPVKKDLSRLSTLLLYSLATSIDALAAGIALSMLEKSVWVPASIALISTFFLSLVGVLGGAKIGAKIGGKAELFGGIVLIAIGIKVVLEHVFY
jgi:putative Mn2+ efflux pump MntP